MAERMAMDCGRITAAGGYFDPAFAAFLAG